MLNDNHFKVDPSKLAGIRVLADAMSFNELAALVAMFGLRQAQECNTDMLECGELSVEELMEVNTPEAYAGCAVDMMTDMLNDMDLGAVVRANDLAKDYVLDFEVKIVGIKRRV